jgi:predicted site-specific integrase-resolvase
MRASAVPPFCLDVRSAAAAVGVSVWVLRRYIDEGLLPTVKFPSVKYPGETSRRVLVSVEDLRAFVERYRVRAS